MRRLPLLLVFASVVFATVWVWVAAPTDVRLTAHVDLGHCVVGRPEVWCPLTAMCPAEYSGMFATLYIPPGNSSASVSLPVSPRDIIDWAVAKGSIGQVNITVVRYLMWVDANGCWRGYITYMSICMPKPVWANVEIDADMVWLNGTVVPFSIVLAQPDAVNDTAVCYNFYLQPTAAVPLGGGGYIYAVPYTFDNITITVTGRWFPVKAPS